ncbi:MAG: hypothetical protein U0411_11245 [Thermodesulfovibrionales bacterium]
MQSGNGGRRDRPGLRIVIWLLLLAAGVAGWLLLRESDPARAWRALLINFLYFTPLAIGLVTWSAIVIASNGRWAGQAERLTWIGSGFLVPSLLLLIALWIGSPGWAPWFGRKLPQGAWLDNTFLFVRDLAALCILWAVAFWYRGRRRRGRNYALLPATLLVLAYCLVFTLLAFDLVMALDPHWHSAIFGAYFFISGLYGAVVAWTLLAVFQPDFSGDLRNDMGSLVITFSILTTYMFFIQLITIWYENMPAETVYVVPRMNYAGWRLISFALIAVLYLGPLVVLLTAWARRNRIFLGIVAAVLLGMLWVERWWLVAPTFSPSVTAGWIELASALGVLGAFGLSMEWSGSRLSRMPVEEEGPR